MLGMQVFYDAQTRREVSTAEGAEAVRRASYGPAKRVLLETLLATDADCKVMHEGFDCQDPKKFTREWFAWANSLFALFALSMKK